MSESALKQAIDYLAALNPDLATEQNGIGFNGVDTPLGMKLASIPESQWTPRQTRAAWRMLAKYSKTQLPAAGIDYDAIPEPPAIAAPKNKSIQLSADRKRITIRFDYDPALVQAVKGGIPGRKFDPASKTWNAPITAASVEPLMRLVADHDFDASDDLIALCSELIEQREERLEMSRASVADFSVDGLGGELRPFQKAGVQYMLGVKRGFIADEMGLGKTVQALATIHAAQAFPAIVVCPASLKLNWKREAEKWLPGRTVSVWNGKAGSSEAEIIVINYDVLKKHLDALKAINAKAVILDESHYIKSYKAKRTEAAKELLKGAEYRIMLTGTPVLNRPQELISQLSALGRLNDIHPGGFWEFAKRYCGAHPDRFGWNMAGASNLAELNERMRSTCYVRRNKADVLKELPAKQRADVSIEIDNRREYDRALRDLINWLGERAESDEEFLASIAHLSEAEQRDAKDERRESAEQRAAQAEQLVRIEALKQLSARGKMKAVIDWVESFLETGEKLVIFAHHVEIVETLAEKFNAPSITGSTPVERRQANVDLFQSDPDTRLIVCNIQAGGVGITLTAASNVAFVELPWRPGDLDQAEDRTHRIGQTDSVTAWYLLGENTIDQEIAALISKKRAVVDAATDGSVITEDTSILKDLLKSLRGKK